MESEQVLALYGFRSKQEFIYRTNRMKEITGASELIANMFQQFLEKCTLPLEKEWKGKQWLGVPSGKCGVVVYEGGGNLCLLFDKRENYLALNKEFSLYVLKTAPGLGLLAASTPYTENFKSDLSKLHASFDKAKRLGSNTEICNVLPYTKIDRKTFQSIVVEDKIGNDAVERSKESDIKNKAYDAKAKMNPSWAAEGKFIDNIGDKKGEDSLIAVVYCDGNSIGQKLKEISTIEDMRKFSEEVHRSLVETPLDGIRHALSSLDEKRRVFRTIIDHGDEITLIVNAHVVPTILKAYFEAIEETGDYHACAGVAVCHPHDPFAQVYKIAEECCESAKAKNRKNILSGGNEVSYVDFHFCRSGITGSLQQIRDAQEKAFTLRPYAYSSSDSIGFTSFIEAGNSLMKSKVSRRDIKNLGNIILSGASANPASSSAYLLEMQRLKFKDGTPWKEIESIEGLAKEDTPKLLFDISGFFDVWFDGGLSQAETEGGSYE